VLAGTGHKRALFARCSQLLDLVSFNNSAGYFSAQDFLTQNKKERN